MINIPITSCMLVQVVCGAAAAIGFAPTAARKVARDSSLKAIMLRIIFCGSCYNKAQWTVNDSVCSDDYSLSRKRTRT